MRLLLPVSLLSAAALAYEILLMRLFSIIQWHHFAYMVISLALLGYGASGAFIALARDWLLGRFAAAFACCAAGFGLAAPAAFAVAQRIPFDPLEAVWEPSRLTLLFAIYLVLAVPFFCAATAIGLALARHGERIGALYRADLLGAGAGAPGLVVALFFLPAEGCLRLLGALGAAAAALAALAPGFRGLARGELLALAGGVLAVAILLPAGALAPRLSPYKGLSKTLQLPGAQIVEERSGPLGLLTVVESDRPPLRLAPGLSLLATTPIPSQIAVFSDGDAPTAITRDDGRREALAFLDQRTAALPYHLLTRPRVLVLGAGGGAEVLLARYHDAAAIDAVELNPQMVDLVRETHGGFAGGLYEHPEVRVHVAEARGFVARSRESYDLIQVALLDSFSASAAGLQALTESTLYTVEALETYLGRLAPGGLLAITRWLRLPPRDNLKLFATAVVALEAFGADPARRLVLVRSWDTATLLVKNGAFTPAEIAAARAFAEARAFDVAYLPGIAPEEVNRFNLLPRPYLYEGALALLGPGREAFLRDYKFDVRPATDDRPYFFLFFKWKALPELLALRETGGVQLLEWGYLILVATLAQAALGGVVLILLPLVALWAQGAGGPGRDGGGAAPGWREMGRVAFYFFALGLAFLFIEMAFIQRFALFLSHPLYATAVVLAAFLVFAGLGSGFSPRLVAREGRPIPRWCSPVTLAVVGIVIAAALYLLALPALFEWWIPLPQAARAALAVALIAPLAFCMGLPFPLGLGKLAARAPRLVPWAWGINGCASVVGAVLATLLAVHLGFTAVVALALALYALAAWSHGVG